MIAVSSIAVTLWLGGWLRPFPNCAERRHLGPGVLSDPRAELPVSGGNVFLQHGAHAEASVLSRADRRPARDSAWCWRLIGVVLFVPPVRDWVQDIFWFSRQSRGFYVPVHLVSWHVPALPLRPADEGRLEDTAADWNRRSSPDRDCGSVLLNYATCSHNVFLLYAVGARHSGRVLVITRKNAVHSALALILSLLALAGLYLMLYAPFVAGVQIILYAGGIMVLFLFVIMLVNLKRSQKEEQFNQQWIAGLLAAVALGGSVHRNLREGSEAASAEHSADARGIEYPAGGRAAIWKLYVQLRNRLVVVAGGNHWSGRDGEEKDLIELQPQRLS